MNTVFPLILQTLVLSSASAEYLSLDGNQWQVINQNKTIKTKARVPGSIYSDLRREGILKEDIYREYNDINYRWVSYDNWTYERTFNVESSLLTKQSVSLVAKGLDTISTVYINGKELGKSDNQHIRYKFNVKNILKSGENTIKIAFISAPIYAKQKSEEYKQKFGYEVPPECTPPWQRGECHYNFIRKMQSSFSWNWGPAFLTQGIWKPIGIEAFNEAIIRDITVETKHDNILSIWALTVNAFVETSSYKEVEGVFNIKLDNNQLITNERHILKPESDGTVKVKFIIPIKDISIITWFPNGVSNNTQKLYQLKVSISFANSSEISTQTKRIGFRTIELVQEPIQPKGLTFNFKVNGVTIFAKGSNWIPAHVLMEELTPQNISLLLLSAKDANMNMLRVWGGGVYESDLFYELADELGLMIWQDFMFACALYPVDKNYLKSVDIEARQQIRRLQHHPSISIWAGNNENQWLLADPWYPVIKTNESTYKKDYVELYIDHIKSILHLEDTTRSYVSSSPSNGLEDEKEKWTVKQPNDPRFGDIHFYNYTSKLWDWRSYPSPKFVSEYGFESYASLEAYNEVVDEKELTYPVSSAVDHRTHDNKGDMVMQNQAGYYFNLPTKGGSDKFDDLIYLTQITQSMIYKTETEFYRRNRDIDPNTGNGYTMGALYWQLNDIWQAPDKSSIEYRGKWKALHYFAKHFFNNLLVSPYEDSNQTLKVSLVRDDYYGELDFDISIKVYKWSETKPIHEINTKVKTNSFSAKVVYIKQIPELLKESKCLDRTECVLRFEVKNDYKNLEVNNFMLLSEPKNSKLMNPSIKIVDVKQSNSSKGVFDITLSSERVAPFVLLDFKLNSGIRGHFSDNGFFIFNNQTIVEFIPISNSYTTEQIKDNLRVKTVNDIK